MPTYYIESNNITMYPCSNRGDSDVQSRLMTEYNITSIVNRLVDKESFVISTNANGSLEFNIHGYYFKVDSTAISGIEDIFSGSENIYAVIEVGSNSDFIEIKAFPKGGIVPPLDDDTDGKFRGVEFTDNIETYSQNDKYHTLLILKKVSGSWVIPPESRVKFVIDDGEL